MATITPLGPTLTPALKCPAAGLGRIVHTAAQLSHFRFAGASRCFQWAGADTLENTLHLSN
jgi:hypothetical protein